MDVSDLKELMLKPFTSTCSKQFNHMVAKVNVVCQQFYAKNETTQSKEEQAHLVMHVSPMHVNVTPQMVEDCNSLVEYC